MKRVAIFASGAGTNALRLIEASRQRSDVLITTVIVDQPASPLPKLVREKYPLISCHLVEAKGLTKSQHEVKILSLLEQDATDWIFFAGFMRIIGPTLLKAFPDRIINIHPSLLPAYPGTRAYERAFDDNVAQSGITIHLVDGGVDTGPILLQESFLRLSTDTLEDFINRGKSVEWNLYPQIFDHLDNLMNRYQFTIFTKDLSESQVYWIDSSKKLSEADIAEILAKLGDAIDQKVFVNSSHDFLNTFAPRLPLKVTYFKPGVTDNPARCVQELLANLRCFQNVRLAVYSGILAAECSYNPLIQSQMTLINSGHLSSLPELEFNLTLARAPDIKTYDFLTATDTELTALSAANCWALSLSELTAIQEYFKGLDRNPTDVEIEMLAQTWSEHCKHKIFNAEIDYQDEQQKLTIRSLFKEYIKAPTFKLNKPWAVSLFDDNAGVVRFRDGMDLCIKVETHNSPSALDPYGGALTGILGVNRDIMGTGLGAKPVANTDVFCVGMPDETDLPETLLHPQEILKGIHKGVQDGGNKSGIPTVNGAIYFDESYSGKPLVYCGTVGLIPPEINGTKAVNKGQRPGDFIVMVGGDVGIDGIHGATASSLVMDKSTTIGMVQIGDPFTQKRMLDFILAARDELLYNSITDNGAGGLSSSVGEMCAATNGAVLKLETVPVKYPGLSPWQILVSESQERMTLSVLPENWERLQALAKLYGVKATHIGVFTDTGTFSCEFNGEKVCELALHFLHDGLPKLKLKANFTGSYKSWKKKTNKRLHPEDHSSIMGHLLSHPVIASKERWIRQYDHEVQGGTVVKPMEGLSSTGPNNAGVMWYGAYGLDGFDGFAIASGLCPHFSIDDTDLMARLAVDEAVRNLICHGADPEKIALVDNFCWPDPTPSTKNPEAEFKLAQLVRSCMGLKDMLETYGMPLVSGKDSMKNDYHGEKLKISVLPTLLMTALGHVPDVRIVPRSQISSRELVYRIGHKEYSSYFGHFLHELCELPRQNTKSFNWKGIRALYARLFEAIQKELISSLHDVSEGGFLPALTESLMMNQLGINLSFQSGVDRTAFLYSELPGHFVASVSPEKQTEFEAFFETSEWELMGVANESGIIGVDKVKLEMKEMTHKWRQL